MPLFNIEQHTFKSLNRAHNMIAVADHALWSYMPHNIINEPLGGLNGLCGRVCQRIYCTVAMICMDGGDESE